MTHVVAVINCAGRTPMHRTGRSACATEAGTGHGWDAVTEMLPVFVGRPEAPSHRSSPQRSGVPAVCQQSLKQV